MESGACINLFKKTRANKEQNWGLPDLASTARPYATVKASISTCFSHSWILNQLTQEIPNEDIFEEPG